jgi:hypothetical protein
MQHVLHEALNPMLKRGKVQEFHHHRQWLHSPSGPWPPLIRFRNHSVRHMVGLPGLVISPSQGLYLHSTAQHNVDRPRTKIHAPSGTGTRDPVYERAATGSAVQRFTDQKYENYTTLHRSPCSKSSLAFYGHNDKHVTYTTQNTSQLWSNISPQTFLFLSAVTQTGLGLQLGIGVCLHIKW